MEDVLEMRRLVAHACLRHVTVSECLSVDQALAQPQYRTLVPAELARAKALGLDLVEQPGQPSCVADLLHAVQERVLLAGRYLYVEVMAAVAEAMQVSIVVWKARRGDGIRLELVNSEVSPHEQRRRVKSVVRPRRSSGRNPAASVYP